MSTAPTLHMAYTDARLSRTPPKYIGLALTDFKRLKVL
jgi:hypothetical protein